MVTSNTPPLSNELLRRIKLVRRDIGNLLFHFTRKPETDNYIEVKTSPTGTRWLSSSASAVLMKILYEQKLIGTSKWTSGENCICFTEAPIQEFNSIFSLVDIASSLKERPRYEPYGIAINRDYLYRLGGRPVIYDHPNDFCAYPAHLKYRFVPHDPENGIDFMWEREWRIKTDALALDPKYTLVVVPSSAEAFELVYDFAEEKADYDVEGSSGEGYITGIYHEPKWLAVSLDVFGIKQ